MMEPSYTSGGTFGKSQIGRRILNCAASGIQDKRGHLYAYNGIWTCFRLMAVDSNLVEIVLYTISRFNIARRGKGIPFRLV